MMTCTCKDWKPNIKIINGYITMDAIHAWGNKEGYTGKAFRFCPWCGKELVKAKYSPAWNIVPEKRK